MAEQYGPPAPNNLYGPYGRTGNSPVPRAPGQTQNGVQPQFDPNAMAQLFAMMGQNQLQQQESYFANQHRRLGMGGEDITGQKGPYDSGGIDWLKANRMSAPEQAAQFEGRPQMAPPQAQNPMSFGQQTHSNPFIMPQRTVFPDSSNAVAQQGLQNNMQTYAPGGYAPQPWIPAQGDFAQVTQAQPKQKPRKPMGFGASASPRPGSSFGF